VFCRNCGSQLPDGVTFCPSCGTPVRSANGLGDQPPAPVPHEAQQPPPAAPAMPPPPPPTALYHQAPPPLPPPPPGVPVTAQVSSWWGDVRQRAPFLTLPVAGGAALAGLALLIGFVGVVVTSASSSNKASGATLTNFGMVLAAIAVALVVLDRAGSKVEPPVWRPAIFVGGGILAVGALFSLIGLVKAYDFGPEAFDGYWAWLPFGATFALIGAGFGHLMRPVPALPAKIFAASTGGVALVLALVGLGTGLGSDFTVSYIPHGVPWLSWALVWAIVAIAGGLSQRTT
jgi:zinc-ribbon domain